MRSRDKLLRSRRQLCLGNDQLHPLLQAEETHTAYALAPKVPPWNYVGAKRAPISRLKPLYDYGIKSTHQYVESSI